ncbi:MAG: Flp family type IVb pilin [Pirellulales bacterium]
MSGIRATWHRFWRDSDGVTSTEYAVMLALILGVCTTSINCLGLSTRQTFQSAGDAMQTSGGESDDAGS